jgi:hypothetical protein
MKKLLDALTGDKAAKLLGILMAITLFLTVTAFGVWMFKLILGMLGVI